MQRRFELPGFTSLFRLARKARTSVNDAIYRRDAGKLAPDVTAKLDQLLRSQQGKSLWDGLKREPKQPNVREVMRSSIACFGFFAVGKSFSIISNCVHF